MSPRFLHNMTIIWRLLVFQKLKCTKGYRNSPVYVPKNITKRLQEKTCVEISFLIPVTLLKETTVYLFPYEFCKIFQNKYFADDLLGNSSGVKKIGNEKCVKRPENSLGATFIR